LDSDKIRTLGWQTRAPFEKALESTVLWYRDNPEWWGKIKSGEFRDYYQKLYGARLGT
jgi:dTDP-glucose 4,6-dehydratase